MEINLVVQGRSLSPQDIDFLSQLIKQNPSWSRRHLSIQLCRLWNWRNANGQIKDMAARAMMLKLDKLGYLKLPPRRQTPSNRMLTKRIESVAHQTTAIECDLKKIKPLQVVVTRKHPQHESLFACLLSHYHYLGYRGIVGENMKYLIFDCHQRVLACVLFGSAAWSVQCRDNYIGWDAHTRKHNLNLTTNNMRFLILPWVRVTNLASHILGLICRRLGADWVNQYGHRLYLLETYVDKDRFTGACYKAANWIHVGQTKGRSRNDRHARLQVPIKDVYLFPLIKQFEQKLKSI
ncbi:MAG: Druantia anti-phage system protein DruA [Planctomycetota bacterium]|jgi:hypothetical protein